MASWTNFGDVLDPLGEADRAALIDLREPAAPREWTRGELDRAADAVARGLVARGHKRGDRIAVLSANRAEFLVAFFGTMRAGMVSVPVNFKLPPATIDYVVRDAGASLIFADRERRALCPADLPVVELDPAGSAGFKTFLDAGPYDVVSPEPDEVALILYTSGSTGRPKGVPLTHAGQLWAVEHRIRSGSDLERQRLLVAAPLFHMNALCVSTFALAARARVVLLPQFQVRAYVDAIARFRCTWLTSVPTMMALVAREPELVARTDLSSVERVSMGSAPLTQALVDRVRTLFPRALITNGYGTTETGPVAFGPHPAGIPRPDVALGYPVPGVEARLVRGEDRDADEGVLELRTPALMPGYHNLPERTAAVMTADGYYVTGDIMRRDADGFYHFVGRADDMFVCGGENVYPGEVETMLERHPGIQEACVVPVPDDVRGEIPVAFVVAVPGADLSPAAVKAWALAEGPAYQHPRHLEIVRALPLGGTGKVDRAALTARATELVARSGA
jgi:acyl-CoA synthetase (AMP-forming)/AMP-acid ligase II